MKTFTLHFVEMFDIYKGLIAYCLAVNAYVFCLVPRLEEMNKGREMMYRV